MRVGAAKGSFQSLLVAAVQLISVGYDRSPSFCSVGGNVETDRRRCRTAKQSSLRHLHVAVTATAAKIEAAKMMEQKASDLAVKCGYLAANSDRICLALSRFGL